MAYNHSMMLKHDNMSIHSLAAFLAFAAGAFFLAAAIAGCAPMQAGQAARSSVSFATEELSDKSASAEEEGLSGKSASTGAKEPAEASTLVCIGDSITYGMGAYDPSQSSWPALLQEKLGADWTVVNLGVSGTTLLNEGAFPYRSTGNVERAKEADPHMVIIMLGTNDASSALWDEGSYRAQLSALVDELVEASSHDLQVVMMAPPCTFYSPIGDARHDSLNETIGVVIRNAVKDIAAEKGARYIDLFAFTENHPEWFPDNLHPNEIGYQAIADYVFDQVLS